MDPTHFSAVRHHYQRTAEFLLDGRDTFPEINKKDLEAFRDTYGASAYVCRYLHCFFSTNGFESSSQRATHELKHQRRFRCAHSSCVHFRTGFVTRSLLNKHNERYHPAIAEGPSLADSITPPTVPSVVQEPEGSLMVTAMQDSDEDSNIFSKNYNRGSGGNHSLEDHQMQLMLLEQQNKKRLMMDDTARIGEYNTRHVRRARELLKL